MDNSYIFPLEPMALISLFALAWFVVGILVGRTMPKRRLSGGSGGGGGGGGDRDRDRRRNRQPQPERSSNGGIELYVGNLSYEMTDADITTAFEAHGKVLSGRIIQNRFNGKSKGYGFVEMSNREQALAAIRALNGKDFKGRRIVVNEAKSTPRND